MKKILLVKTSSMGDVIHNLPVASDILSVLPGSHIDWVVEESFAAVPRLHPGVRRLFHVALRRWRANWWRVAARREIARFADELKAETYDAVIDTQGLLKSALVTWCARGARYGLDWKSAREPLASFYDRTFSVPWTLHAVERNRALAAQALNFAVPNGVNYGITARAASFEWLPAGSYVVLLHASSAPRKLWPEGHWIDLGGKLAAGQRFCVLPWGNPEERGRSERLAREIPRAVVPPQLALAEVAALLAGAGAVVGVDTGLTHLAGALKVPTVGVYCDTDPAATGLYGCARAANVGGIGRSPPVDEVSAALEGLGSTADKSGDGV